MVIGDRGAILDFVLLMKESGLLDAEDEYAIVAADTSVSIGEDGNCQKYIVPSWTVDQEDLATVHEAFRSVLMIVPTHKDARQDDKYRYGNEDC